MRGFCSHHCSEHNVKKVFWMVRRKTGKDKKEIDRVVVFR